VILNYELEGSLKKAIMTHLKVMNLNFSGVTENTNNRMSS